MRKSCCNVDDSCEIPFLVDRFQVSSTSPVDRDGGLGIIPYVALTFIEAVVGPNRQSRSGYDSDLGLCCSFDGRDFGLVIHLDTDNGTELATFGEAADEAITEHVCEFLVLHLRDWVEGHLVGDWGGFIGHFDGDDVVEVGLVDFVLVDDGSATGAFDGTVLDGGAGGDIERLYYVRDVVHHARGVCDDLDDILVWRCWFGRVDRCCGDCCCGDRESIGTGGQISGR